ncbi:MAG TPA: DegQ family serine endoprotease, partial [Mariprofundaceae bacterium]|nr:DegQ family serine endoprotease [Mariprofundaceae bacterium]
ALPDSFADLAAQESPSVVNVSTTEMVRGPQIMPMPFGQGSPFNDFFHQFFDNPQPQERHSLGSGFIISSDGYILTNNHVIKGADSIMVRLTDDKEYKAKVVGKDSKLDLALLKIDAKGLRPVKLGDSDKIRVGDWVVAIGNPFGLGQTVTAGIVSAKERVIGAGPYDDFIQTDAAINPGNSGGPLFDAQGEVIGINAAIYTRSGGNNGIGFAIPINLAKAVLNQLRTTGHVQRARLGVEIADIDEDTMKALGLKSQSGALVQQVEAGSAAEKAGIRPSDVIVMFDGHPIRKAHDLPFLVASRKPGEKVSVGIIRDGKPISLDVKVEAMPEESSETASTQDQGGDKVQLGVALQDLTPELRDTLRARVKHGVVVKQVMPGMPADRAGIQRGDVIYRVNGKDVDSLDAFLQMAKHFHAGEALRIMMDRSGDQVFALVMLPEENKDQ